MRGYCAAEWNGRQSKKDNGDNGTYVIYGWEIVDRLYFGGPEQHEYDMKDMLEEINSSMPEGERIDLKGAI